VVPPTTAPPATTTTTKPAPVPTPTPAPTPVPNVVAEKQAVQVSPGVTAGNG
jgi:hypothetical protein